MTDDRPRSVVVAAQGALLCDVAIVDIKVPPTHTGEGLRPAIEIREQALRRGDKFTCLEGLSG